jgi:hypothetical protein
VNVALYEPIFETAKFQWKLPPIVVEPSTSFDFKAVRSAFTTTRLSLAKLPSPPFELLTFPLVLVYVPSVIAVTSILTAQFPPAEIVPLNSSMLFPPTAAVMDPPHVLFNTNGAAFTTPEG